MFLALSAALVAQSDWGGITGTVTDPAGAAVSGASLQAIEASTGAKFRAGTSGTGNYALQLPPGIYSLTVTAPKFKKYVRDDLAVSAPGLVRIDVSLALGPSSESITVSGSPGVLYKENSGLNQTVAGSRLDDLPVLQIGSGTTTGLRDPYAVVNLLPGSSPLVPDENVRLNGNPSNSMAFRIEGQDAYSGLQNNQSWTQPSVDAIGEFSVETSNFPAEFGLAGGGLFNVTMRSGTNQYHGSAYDYLANDALNAGIPFTANPADPNQHLRPRVRKNDFGFTFGGAVRVPKFYDGRSRTFFFFSLEEYRETDVTNNVSRTVPTPALEAGDFSAVELSTPVYLNGAPLTTPLGDKVFSQEIFDPASTRTVNGETVRSPFPNQQIPVARMDPVALAIQSYFPAPDLPGAANNFLTAYTNQRLSSLPSLKIDHSFNPEIKLSGYWSRTATSYPNRDGLPAPISSATADLVTSDTVRLNYDQTLAPTVLLHFGAGVIALSHRQQPAADSFNDATLGPGLRGAYTNLFPYITGLANPNQPGFSGILGPYTPSLVKNIEPTANAGLTWVKQDHVYKFGGEMVIDGYPASSQAYANGDFSFAAPETGLPYLNGLPGLAGSPGYGYASFLLGAVDSFGIGVPTDTRLGDHAFSFFAQDSWKIARRLTLDYGLRYDDQSYLRAENGVLPQFGPNIVNASAGGRLGGTQFEAVCHCSLARNYPFAFAPRLGLAYQITPRTILRAGAAVVYSRESPDAGLSYDTGSYYPIANTSYGSPLFTLAQGSPFQIAWPNFSPSQYPLPNTTAGPLVSIASDAGRPARQIQWSLGFQREIAPDLTIQADYMGNRGVWWTAPSQLAPNALTLDALAQFGFNLADPAAVQRLLATKLSQVTPALLENAGLPAGSSLGQAPYPGFPLSDPVAQALRPYPQFGNLTYFLSPALGDTWYDALQVAATRRLSHGLEFQGSFTWSKQETEGAETASAYFPVVNPAVNDVHNHAVNKYLSGFDQPFLLVLSPSYTTPRFGSGFAHGSLPGKIASWIAGDWQIGALLRYGSGLPLQAPLANNALSSAIFQSTFANRVPGQPLFLQNLNCHCFDPNTQLVLNPAAWSEPGPLQWGTAAAYYGDYRQARHPMENLSFGRRLRIGESGSFQIRAEFTNIFNRTVLGAPLSASSVLPAVRNGSGQLLSGFGFISTLNGGAAAPRSGQMVARFEF